MSRAVFLDRDGVLNPLIEYSEWGPDSPARPEDLHLFFDAAETIRNIRASGYVAVLISNQPGVAKGKYTLAAFRAIEARLTALLEAEGTGLDGAFYCLHHPQATVPEYRVNCSCRKPKTGLLLKAAERLDIDLKCSYFIGDRMSDVTAAQLAGCTPILLWRDTASTAPQVGESVAVVPHLSAAFEQIHNRRTA
jgi:D,D-heptose 1,7-bisphosphate phosphatase